jgi:hypothetical protein
VSQEVASPRDADVTADIGSMDKMKQMIEKNETSVPQPVVETSAYPDATKHKYISFAKSAIRIVAGGCLITGNLLMAGICFIMAEILGIVEEIV